MRTHPPESGVDVVVVGSANIDLSARVREHPQPGQTVPASALTITPGGKGANQAVAAARLGASTAMIGRIGNDAHAETLLHSLHADGVDTTYVTRDQHTPTGTALITVTDSGENSIVVAGGANARVSEADIDAARTLLTSARVVSLVLEIPIDAVIAAAHTARASARIVLNLSPVTDLPSDVLALADPLIVNEHEAREVLRDNGIASESGIDMAVALRRLGPRSAVVTLGPDGAALANADQSEYVPGVPADVVDTTGAGDAFAAALAVGLSQGATLSDATRQAIHVSAHSVSHPGAQSSYPSAAE